MKSSHALSTALLAVLALAAATVAAGDEAARGAEILAPLKQDLKAALLAGLEKGPEAAITVCKDQAPAIARSLSVNDVRVGRSSHRLRNPANTSPAWVESILKGYLANPAQREPALVSLAENRRGYVEPIALQPMCLVCHGETLSPGVAAKIREDYPQDRATGFAVGDLRGVYWAEFAAQE